nr:hypothetical protein [Sodalis sp. dw_96]
MAGEDPVLIDPSKLPPYTDGGCFLYKGCISFHRYHPSTADHRCYAPYSRKDAAMIRLFKPGPANIDDVRCQCLALSYAAYHIEVKDVREMLLFTLMEKQYLLDELETKSAIACIIPSSNKYP